MDKQINCRPGRITRQAQVQTTRGPERPRFTPHHFCLIQINNKLTNTEPEDFCDFRLEKPVKPLTRWSELLPVLVVGGNKESAMFTEGHQGPHNTF